MGKEALQLCKFELRAEWRILHLGSEKLTRVLIVVHRFLIVPIFSRQSLGEDVFLG